MSIITKPSSISKNVAASFSLSKSELAAVASVAADSTFSNSSNWKNVTLCYKSSPGNQRRFVRFDATVENPTGNFISSLKSKNVFEIESITIKDSDNGFIVIPASQLTASEFKIDMGAVAPPLVETLKISQLLRNTSSVLGLLDGSSNNGMTFTTDQNFLLTKFELGTSFIQSGVGAIQVTLRTYDDINTVLATSNFLIGLDTNSAGVHGWSSFTFSDYQLTAGVKYALMFYFGYGQSTNLDGTDYSSYANGGVIESGVENTSRDLMFKIYGK